MTPALDQHVKESREACNAEWMQVTNIKAKIDMQNKPSKIKTNYVTHLVVFLAQKRLVNKPMAREIVVTLTWVQVTESQIITQQNSSDEK